MVNLPRCLKWTLKQSLSMLKRLLSQFAIIAGNPNPQMSALAQEMLETVSLREKYQPKE